MSAPEANRPPFAEPWQAQLFAMTVALNERGVFEWPSFAEALGNALQHQKPDGSDYYDCWLSVLETILRDRSIAKVEDVDALTAAWQRAAEATPHGSPIELANDPLGSAG